MRFKAQAAVENSDMSLPRGTSRILRVNNVHIISHVIKFINFILYGFSVYLKNSIYIKYVFIIYINIVCIDIP